MRMFQQITKNVKIVVKTVFNDRILYRNQAYYSFSYHITIENNSKNTIKLLERFWTILDSLNDLEYVQGHGVVGRTPVLKPNEKYSYSSNCLLHSTIGAMKGSYKMIDFETSEEFLVSIPTFQLITPANLN